MHKVLILACCAVSVSFTFAYHRNTSQNLNVPIRKNESESIVVLGKVIPKNSDHSRVLNESENSAVINHINEKDAKGHGHFTNKSNKSLPLLHKIHARITRSKDAVWATITLTFMCVLLFLAVAQSRMWKDNKYSEAHGVPLPNFNERVLFKGKQFILFKLL